MEVLDVAVPDYVAAPDHANENQEVNEIPNFDAQPTPIYDAHNYRR